MQHLQTLVILLQAGLILFVTLRYIKLKSRFETVKEVSELTIESFKQVLIKFNVPNAEETTNKLKEELLKL